MASLFGPSTLRLELAEKLRLQQIADSQKVIADTLVALLAKVNEPEPPDTDTIPVSEVQAMIDGWSAALRETRLHSEDEIRRLSTEALRRVSPPATPQP